MIAIVLAVFAFTTVLGWSFYCEKCLEYLFGVKAIMPFRITWVLVVPVGATLDLGFVGPRLSPSVVWHETQPDPHNPWWREGSHRGSGGSMNAA